MTAAGTCRSCGAAGLLEGARFCHECGAPTVAGCVSCGESLLPGARFCSNCGTSQPGVAPAAATPAMATTQPQPVAARRVTSVLFGDLVGFTTLSESRDQEEVRELLSAYFEDCRLICDRYGGTIEKFIGDAVMAVWGVPTAHEDDAERAVRAGLELTAAVEALGERQGAPGLSMRVGIVTGEVAVTIGATQQGMVAGDAVNTASRVQSAAAPGQVWVDETTRLLTSSAITYVDVGSHVLKGKAEPMPLWAVRAVVASIGGAQRADGLEAPLVARDRELRLIKELFHAAAESARPALLVVDGEPGVGKSRLAWEFEKYVDGLTQTTFWHSGRCVAYGEGVAFFALAEAFRIRLQALLRNDSEAAGEEIDDPETLLTRGLAVLDLPASESEWLKPRIGALLGIGSVGTFPREDLFSAWTTFLERVCASEEGGHVVLVIDDAQNADEGLLQFLEHLLVAGSLPCLVVLLTRPGLLEEHPRLATNRAATVVHLPKLSDADVSALLSGLVVGLPDEVREGLVARSEGVPLYAVETVRSLIDRDLVVPRGGQYVLADPDSLDLTTIGAPASLQALVAARLDSLSADQRVVLDHASVLGMSFPRSSIEALCGNVGDLDGILSGLVRQQLLGYVSNRLSADYGEYRFEQTVVRQVAYAMLGRRERKAMHLAVVRQFEAEPDAAGDLAPFIAQHYLDAVEAAPSDPDVPTLRGAAIAQLTRAASRARSLGAQHDGAGHLRAALELSLDQSEAARIRLELADALLMAGDYDGVIEQAVAATERFDAEGDELSAGLAVALHAEALSFLGGVSEAKALVQPRWDALSDRSDANRTVLRLASAQNVISLGLGFSSLEFAAKRLLLSQRLGDQQEFCAALSSLAGHFLSIGLPSVWRTLTGAAADMAREHHQPKALVRALSNLAAGNLDVDLRQAFNLAQEAQEAARTVGDATMGLNADANTIIAGYALGEWRAIDENPRKEAVAAHAFYSAILASFEGLMALARGQVNRETEFPDTEDLAMMGWASHARGILHLASGELGLATEHQLQALRRIHEIADLSDDFPMMFQTAVETALAAGDHQALAAMLELVRYDDDSDHSISTAIQGHRNRTRGLLAVRDGDHEGAEAAFRQAIEDYRSWKALLYQRRTEADLAVLLVEAGRAEQAAPLLEQVRAFYDDLGAVVWAAELESRLPASVSIT
ncbi:MAG TPA: adenylate/guanylate cyclase domain-containing protein [Nocardioidaceae bacterium]|nr:adenylate/guanylate cyclase domain-containing protein [Nocardioidaceae bacterium]